MAALPPYRGLVQYRRARSTGTHVGVYRADEAGFEDDPETPWATVCEEHAGIVCHTTRRTAVEWSPRPHEWCPTCQDNRTTAEE